MAKETIPEIQPWGETKVVGKRLPRVDGYERASGSAVFSIDMALPEMLHAAILRCPHAHANVKRVDLSAALKMPGVRAALSVDDPEAKIPWYWSGMTRKPTSQLFDRHCRYEGDEVAVVAAETIEQTREALRAIVVEYEPLPFIIDFEEALKPGAPAIHEGGNQVYPPQKSERGDVAKGFAEADFVIEETYRTSCQIHTPVEVHGSVATWDGERLTVWDTTQGPFAIQNALAQYLRLPLSGVRVICPYMGGGFGSKLDFNKHTLMAALLARRTARPVRLFLSREESFRSVGNRPAHRLTLKAGVKKDGTITALELNGIGTVGAYPDWTTTGFQVQDLYRCANVRVEEAQVYTNAGQSRPFRAPGFPQGNWALEQMMDALAEKIGMDPVAFRLKNVPEVSQAEGNKPYTSTGLARCLSEGAAAFGWQEARGRAKGSGHVVRGVGLAAGSWGYQGGPPATAIVKLFSDGSVNLNMGAADIGTGTKTVMAMIVAEELGLPLENVEIEHADTGTTQYTEPSGGSKTVLSDGPPVRAAAIEVRKQLLEMAARQLEVPAAELELREGRIVAVNKPDKSVAVGEVKGLGEQQVIVGVGRRGPNPPDKIGRPFAVHFAEIEVNTRTGEVKVLRMLGAHDSGRVMNRFTYDSQVMGGIVMGIGFGMKERRVLDRSTGKMVNANWHDYKLPTAKEAPGETVVLPIDPHDTAYNTIGAKGLGEPATIPTAAAIANAFYNATGIRIAETPISIPQVVRLLAEKRGEKC